MDGLEVKCGCHDCYVPMVCRPEVLTHDEEGSSIGMHVHEMKTGEVIAVGWLATGCETEYEDEF